jgi:hypothetical protein
VSLAKKWLQWRIAFAAQLRRRGGPMFDIINAAGDLPIEDDDPAALPQVGTKPPPEEVASTAPPAPARPLRKAAQ